MNIRLQQFLSAENISQAQFADTIDVARASVSHVLAGRNKPGYDFIKSISDHYPKLSLEWLINGKGKMYKESITPSPIESQSVQKAFEDDLFSSVEEEKKPMAVENQADSTESIETDKLTHTTKCINNQRTISKIVVFFDDNTYQELV